jgi:hypothetical protein
VEKLHDFIKLYLSMCEWFHDCNDKEVVNQARPIIAKVLKMLQWLFPREENSNGYCIPKMHGMAKFQSYIKRYGSAMNFYGGTGESAHKQSDQQCTLTDGDDVSVELKGKYTLQITNHVPQLMTNGNDIEVFWHSDNKKRKMNNTLYCIDKELVSMK